MTRALDVMSRRVHVADGRLTEVHDGSAVPGRLEPVAARVAGKGGVA